MVDILDGKFSDSIDMSSLDEWDQIGAMCWANGASAAGEEEMVWYVVVQFVPESLYQFFVSVELSNGRVLYIDCVLYREWLFVGGSDGTLDMDLVDPYQVVKCDVDGCTSVVD